jgi:hypothetical protein
LARPWLLSADVSALSVRIRGREVEAAYPDGRYGGLKAAVARLSGVEGVEGASLLKPEEMSSFASKHGLFRSNRAPDLSTSHAKPSHSRAILGTIAKTIGSST